MAEIVLLIVFVLTTLLMKVTRGGYNFALSGRIAMAAMLVFTAIGHVLFTKGMSMMLPEAIPYKIELVYLTGIVELIAAIGLLLPRFRVMTAWWLIAFFILLLPANIYAAVKHVDLLKATFEGNGLSYLWYRIPLQLFFVSWVYLSAIKKYGMINQKNKNT